MSAPVALSLCNLNTTNFLVSLVPELKCITYMVHVVLFILGSAACVNLRGVLPLRKIKIKQKFFVIFIGSEVTTQTRLKMAITS